MHARTHAHTHTHTHTPRGSRAPRYARRLIGNGLRHQLDPRLLEDRTLVQAVVMGRWGDAVTCSELGVPLRPRDLCPRIHEGLWSRSPLSGAFLKTHPARPYEQVKPSSSPHLQKSLLARHGRFRPCGIHILHHSKEKRRTRLVKNGVLIWQFFCFFIAYVLASI